MRRAIGFFPRILPALAALAAPVLAQPQNASEAAARRVHGIINKDDIWSGQILLTEDVTIQDAAVTVEPGTVIEFAQASPGAFPVLTVGAADHGGGELKLHSTVEKPITIRTRPVTNPGRVVVYVHAKSSMPPKANSPGAAPSPPARLSGSADWRHVRVMDLGRVRSKAAAKKEVKIADAAVEFHVRGPTESVNISDCSFDGSARLSVTAADGAQASLVGNRITNSKDMVSVEVVGGPGPIPAGSVVVTRNRLDAALDLRSAPCVVAENILIGLDAAIVVEDDSSPRTKIIGNYVHNTTDQDDGRYCLNCGNPSALIEGNLFRGGTTCVRNGSRQMRRNVLVGAPRLASRFVKHSRTHQLVYALPPGAVFENNLLLGPAFSLLMPQPEVATAAGSSKTAEPSIIRNNLFDGFGESTRAIHLNPLGRQHVTLAAMNNIFLRIPAMFYDEGKTSRSLTFADHNAAAPKPARPYDQIKISDFKAGEPGWGARDVIRDQIGDMGFLSTPPDRLPDFDGDIQSSKLTVTQLREQLLASYRPRPDSPLVHAGIREEGAEATPPTIGPSEP